MAKFIELTATFFYVGKIPWAPGTMGSFAGLLVFLCVHNRPPWYLAVLILILALGFFSGGRAEEIFGRKDPAEVVIDEVCGILLVFFMVPVNWFSVPAGFLLFRFLDIIKIFPAGRLEGCRGGLGIMLDDIVCAIYTNLALRGALKLFA